ncbi:flavodoxin family protein [Tianweitania sediminis]|uniref:Flavodoxin family protein n=1 Tax=Tianweitania sediminis TaxID=1502156 RepID=A0A8J7ULE1_9HYPH|nr:NAD(P)H-dependent oxidoreductase [Tianweitania sediminis]MBP0439327.1 flavodoxin family protein [Tianweitania sediminis]
MAGLTAFALNCSLKASENKESSSTDKLADDLFKAFEKRGVSCSIERALDHDIKPGVESDMGNGDAWPALRQRVLDADIFVLALPIWLGQPSSVAKRVLERMDAFLGETDDKGRMPAAGKVAVVVVVGNEDGAHHVHAECFQALSDVGFTIPANAGAYWVGEAMGSTDYKDLETTPDKVKQTLEMVASNAAHLAALLKTSPYPGVES